jgi:signal transduction histidine kinase
MARRIVLLASLLAVAMLMAGVIASHVRLGAVVSQLEARVTLARALIASHPQPAALERALVAPGLHVIVEDHDNDLVYEWQNGQVVSRPIPPRMGPPPGGPEPGGPEGPEPPQRLPHSRIEQLAGMAVGRAPIRVENDGIVAVIAPDVTALARFMIADALLTLAGIAVCIAGAWWIIAALTRAERTQLERTLEERRVAATEFQRFLADAGHELRTPLTIVSGYVEILTGDLQQSEQGRQILAGMKAETARMRALVEKMLLLARLESMVSIQRLVDVSSVAADVVSQMQARYPTRELTLRTNGDPAIVIDQDDLYEALRNLVENALRYAPTSDVEVDVIPGATTVSIAVIDHGAGIEPGEREKIFERFYRGSAQTDGEGSGLGLAIVSRVASRWNGDVRLDSTPGRTMFTLRFPLVDEGP